MADLSIQQQLHVARVRKTLERVSRSTSAACSEEAFRTPILERRLPRKEDVADVLLIESDLAAFEGDLDAATREELQSSRRDVRAAVEQCFRRHVESVVERPDALEKLATGLLEIQEWDPFVKRLEAFADPSSGPDELGRVYEWLACLKSFGGESSGDGSDLEDKLEAAWIATLGKVLSRRLEQETEALWERGLSPDIPPDLKLTAFEQAEIRAEKALAVYGGFPVPKDATEYSQILAGLRARKDDAYKRREDARARYVVAPTLTGAGRLKDFISRFRNYPDQQQKLEYALPGELRAAGERERWQMTVEEALEQAQKDWEKLVRLKVKQYLPQAHAALERDDPEEAERIIETLKERTQVDDLEALTRQENKLDLSLETAPDRSELARELKNIADANARLNQFKLRLSAAEAKARKDPKAAWEQMIEAEKEFSRFTHLESCRRPHRAVREAYAKSLQDVRTKARQQVRRALDLDEVRKAASLLESVRSAAQHLELQDVAADIDLDLRAVEQIITVGPKVRDLLDADPPLPQQASEELRKLDSFRRDPEDPDWKGPPVLVDLETRITAIAALDLQLERWEATADGESHLEVLAALAAVEAIEKEGRKSVRGQAQEHRLAAVRRYLEAKSALLEGQAHLRGNDLEKAEASLKKAQGHEKTQRAAAEKLEELEEKKRGDEQVLRVLASLDPKVDAETAVKQLEDVKNTPTTLKKELAEARAQWHRKRLDELRALLSAQEGRSALNWRDVEMVLKAMGELDAAGGPAQQARERVRLASRLHDARALEHYADGEFDEAANEWQQAAEQDPTAYRPRYLAATKSAIRARYEVVARRGGPGALQEELRRYLAGALSGDPHLLIWSGHIALLEIDPDRRDETNDRIRTIRCQGAARDARRIGAQWAARRPAYEDFRLQADGEA